MIFNPLRSILVGGWVYRQFSNSSMSIRPCCTYVSVNPLSDVHFTPFLQVGLRVKLPPPLSPPPPTPVTTPPPPPPPPPPHASTSTPTATPSTGQDPHQGPQLLRHPLSAAHQRLPLLMFLLHRLLLLLPPLRLG